MSSKARDAEWYLSILNAINDLILVKGDRSKLLWANRAFLEYYGMTNQELQDIIDAPHSDPDDTVQYVKDDHYVFSSGRMLDIASEPVTNSQGETAYFHTIKNAIFNDGGKVERTVGVSRRISDDQVIQHSAIERSERKSSLNELRTLVRHLPSAVAMLDVKQRFLCLSQQWSQLLGYTGDDLTESFFEDYFASQLPIQTTLEAVLSDGVAKTIESISILTPEQESIIGTVHIHPWFFPDGAVGGAILLIHDITQLKQSEYQLKRANEELMQFNYRVSHDLVAPLKSIKGLVHICQEELYSNPEMIESIHHKMIASVDSLSSLVNELFNLAKADIQCDDNELIEMSEFINSLLILHQEAMDESRIHLHLDISVSEILGNRSRIRQIIDNLLSNAIKYYDKKESERSIWITIKRESANILIRVCDNGLGIDESIHDTAFDMFVRGSAQYSGSGLGLYLVRKHIENMGGEYHIQSFKKNTVVEVSFPVRE
ncbi:PAS domain-containing sensor histidine kinase [Pleionea sp. CnH1-48]|uniref:PAS domain-containing sensor histidine kinase n=1 Tax=Pleionea sp. CnH1-48 TaxID=2954494 RepID=UPI00209847D5|nr:PAS domain-containing sensor histidine kinase [Pleionea sp. CnH1-48]MCO7224903.1 PAS domain-containing sensor histidine kinase [Pleionea sp. CnH1-48]